MEPYIILTCPHCAGTILVYKHEINCAIFRHGTYKSTGAQMEPHAPKDVCDALKASDTIYGCGKPFRIIDSTAVECDYI